MAMLRRRILLNTLTALPALAWARAAPAGLVTADGALHPAWADDVAPGRGVVILMRHATAPGTFDPPGFRLGDCGTQRNLSETGREEARAIGRWFATQGIAVRRVRSSPWCRCMDTASLAFGQSEAWHPLGSPIHLSPQARASALQALRDALEAATAAGGVEVWVSHMFVQADLTGQHTGSGEGLVLRAASDPTGSAPVVIARLQRHR